MAIKKSELYSSLWQSCDELRGGMDASQYKDYVLVLLFIKYISDKYAGRPFAPITVSAGASFKDMVALKGAPQHGSMGDVVQGQRSEIHPKAKPEQAAIAAILTDMDAEIAALEAKLAKARQIKQGMMQELLTGRIRLV
jgi:hypothetical protein